MTDEIGTPITPIEEKKKSNTTLIIIIIVVVVLLCCCCTIVVGGWFFGDQVMRWFNETFAGLNLLLYL